MPWVRYDDQFPIHRKVRRLSDGAYRLHTEAIFWCARNLTDGWVPSEDLGDFATAKRPTRLVPELVDRGLWHEAGEGCASPDCPAYRGVTGGKGWVIHDYFDYQPSKEKVVSDRKATAERQRKWRERQGGNGSRNASRNGVTNAAPSRPGPLPSGERAGGRTSPRQLKPVDDWCGQCTEDTRHIELTDGTVARCPRCHPLRSVS